MVDSVGVYNLYQKNQMVHFLRMVLLSRKYHVPIPM